MKINIWTIVIVIVAAALVWWLWSSWKKGQSLFSLTDGPGVGEGETSQTPGSISGVLGPALARRRTEQLRKPWKR